MEYFKIGYGLITKSDPITENCNTFYARYLTIANHQEIDDYIFHYNKFISDMVMKFNPIYKVYNRRPNPDLRSVSHDEISGWMISSFILKTGHRKEIWNHLVRNFGSYNNTGKLIDYLPFNPGNYYSWGVMNKSLLAYLFYPIYCINLIIALTSPPSNTSAKLQYWEQLENMPKNIFNNWLKKYLVNILTQQYGEKYLSSMLKIYHPNEDDDFPLFVDVKKIGI